jgi:hypothetical protein
MHYETGPQPTFFCSLVLRQDVKTSLFNEVQTNHTTSSNIPFVFITTEWTNTL